MNAIDHFTDYLDRLVPAVKRVRFAGLVAGFGILGFANWWRDSQIQWQAEISPSLFWVGITILLLTNFLLVFIDKQAAELLRALHEQEKQAVKLEEEVGYLTTSRDELVAWLSLTRLLSELVDQALSAPMADDELKSRLFNAAVEFLADFKSRLFGVSDDYLNISIYEFNSADELLHCVACYRSRPSDAEGKHRSWAVGEGHVGKAFEVQTELVCADARAPDVAAWVAAPPSKARPYDNERYVSLAAAPIAVNSEQPLGVIIMTSDRPYRFVNPSEVLDDDDTQRGQYAVDSLQEFSAQLAQLMCILQARKE